MDAHSRVYGKDKANNKMVQDAEANAEEDKKRREGVEARNQAETLIHSAEKSLEEYGDKVSEEDRNEIELAISGLKEAKAVETCLGLRAKEEWCLVMSPGAVEFRRDDAERMAKLWKAEGQ